MDEFDLDLDLSKCLENLRTPTLLSPIPTIIDCANLTLEPMVGPATVKYPPWAKVIPRKKIREVRKPTPVLIPEKEFVKPCTSGMPGLCLIPDYLHPYVDIPRLILAAILQKASVQIPSTQL